ncbi:MAG: hypothetical protein EOO88_21730 [Pedobacter sp.]|nr:MAG: hypothetical protein EOO88_21730 [Pedobacter sp.]
MSNIMRRRGGSPLGGGSKAVLTTKDFLGKTGKEAYVKPTDLLTFVDDGRIEDIQSMDHFFSLIKEDLKMVINRKVLIDRGGVKYKFERFLRPKGEEGEKVVCLGRIEQFTADFQRGKFIIDFSFEELVAEAEKV